MVCNGRGGGGAAERRCHTRQRRRRFRRAAGWLRLHECERAVPLLFLPLFFPLPLPLCQPERCAAFRSFQKKFSEEVSEADGPLDDRAFPLPLLGRAVAG